MANPQSVYAPPAPALRLAGTPDQQYQVGTSTVWGNPIAVSGGIRQLPSYGIWLQNYMTFYIGSQQSATWCVSFGYPIGPDDPGRNVRRIWADGRLVWAASNWFGAQSGYDPSTGFSWVFYPGTEEQPQDPTMAADQGPDYTPAYRGQMIMVIHNFPLTYFQNQIPSITAEIADSAYNLSGIDSNGEPIDLPMPVATQLQYFAKGQSWNYYDYEDSELSFDPVSFSGMTSIGCMILQQWNLIDLLTSYGQFYGFDFTESGAGIKFFKPVNSEQFTVASVITEAELFDDSTDVSAEGAIITTRQDQGAIPSTVQVSYYDQTQQYQLSVQRARRQQFPQKSIMVSNQLTFSVPIIATAQDAMTGATRALYQKAHEQLIHNFSLPANFLYLEPGDVIELQIRGKTYIAKLTYTAIQPDLSMQCIAINIPYGANINLPGYSGSFTSQPTVIRGILAGGFSNVSKPGVLTLNFS